MVESPPAKEALQRNERLAWAIMAVGGLVLLAQVTLAWSDAARPCASYGPCFSLADNLQLMGPRPLLFAAFFLAGLLGVLATRYVATRSPA